MEKLVSIIVPVYNAENYIFECLNSILNQDYDYLEVIVVEDASTDCTRKRIEEFQQNDKSGKIKYIYNKSNQGATKTCNIALSNCNGEYVCFFAGDDIMLPGKIKKQVQFLELNSAYSFCYHNVEVFDSESNKILFYTQPKGQSCSNFNDIIEKGGLPGANSVMARKKFLPLGGYDDALPSVSDWKMFFDIGLNGDIGYICDVLARYRKHPKGLSARANELLLEYHQTLLYFEQILDKKRMSSAGIKKIWRRILIGAIARELVTYGNFVNINRVLDIRNDRLINIALAIIKIPICNRMCAKILTYSKRLNHL